MKHLLLFVFEPFRAQLSRQNYNLLIYPDNKHSFSSHFNFPTSVRINSPTRFVLILDESRSIENSSILNLQMLPMIFISITVKIIANAGNKYNICLNGRLFLPDFVCSSVYANDPKVIIFCLTGEK